MSALQKIEATREALTVALADEDWAAITALDLDCKAYLENVLDDKEVDEQRLRENLEGLLALYRELVGVTTLARQSIAAQMTQARQGHQAAKVYQMARKAAIMR